jgi:hypothetical protein
LPPTRLDVVESRTGKVLSSQEVPFFVRLFPSGNLAHTATLNADGFMSYVIWSYRYVSQ